MNAREFALEAGYPFCEIYDHTSSAGDWTYLVSKDANKWRIMTQTNNWPRAGFDHEISEDAFYGTLEEVCELLGEI